MYEINNRTISEIVTFASITDKKRYSW